MASRVVLGLTSTVKPSVRALCHVGRAVHSHSNDGGLKAPSQFIRSVPCNHEEDIPRFKITRERGPASSDHAARKHLQGGSTLKDAVAKLIDSVNEGTPANSYAYNHVLHWCSKEQDLESLKQVHDSIKDSHMEQHPYVAKVLLKGYIESGGFEIAKETFKKLLKKDNIIWNVMIAGCVKHDQAEGAIEMYKQMRDEGGQPDAMTYLSVLKACTSPTALIWGKDIHAHTIRDGFQADVRIGTALVRMYAKCGSIEEARSAFSRMSRRDVVSWNVMIGGLAEYGLGHEAFSMFLQMQREGFTPNAITYLNILNACSSTGALEWVKEVHAHAMKACPDVDVRVGNALVHMYAKTGSIEDARAVFGRMRRRDVLSWTAMIGGLAEHGLRDEAMSLFMQMQREGLTPDSVTYLSLLNPCSSPGSVEWVKKVHAMATRAGFDVDIRVGNALVQMYAKSGSIEDARAVFDRIGRRDVCCWNGMIGRLAEHGLGHEAFSLFLQMQVEGYTPDVISYLSILNPCSSTGAEEWMEKVHAQAMRAGLDVDVQVGTAFVQMYAKTGLIVDAKQVFDKMETRSVMSWAVMIGGLAQHGHGREALELFERMKSTGVMPNGALFVAVLSACSRAGLVEEGRLQFASMRRDHGIEPALEHYTCMVDLLGRAGHLKEASLFILNMPIQPDVVIWRAFLGACRIHHNIELAELAAKECLNLNPACASTHVLLSNVYAAVDSWDQVKNIRSIMEERGIRKDPGRCWIAVGNKVHHFLVGDTSHSETREIYSMLSSLSEKLKAEGYISDTRLVMRNIAEEDKENAVCSHSEKLAIAYGLMHVPPEKPIRVYKNLRICTDCHAVTKLISKIARREIVARDASRFHHFTDGSCSCGDYW